MKYVCITYRDHFLSVGDDGLVWATGIGPGQNSIFERIEHSGNFVQLRSLLGGFLVPFSAPVLLVAGGLLSARGVAEDDNTAFLEVWHPDDRVSLRSWRGLFCCAEGDGGGLVVVNRNQIGEWEKFHYTVPPPELLPPEPRPERREPDLRDHVRPEPDRGIRERLDWLRPGG